MLNFNRYTGESVPDYVILLQEPPPLFIDKSFSSDIMTTSDLYPMPRNSLHSGRKASYDVRSLGSDGNLSNKWLEFF